MKSFTKMSNYFWWVIFRQMIACSQTCFFFKRMNQIPFKQLTSFQGFLEVSILKFSPAMVESSSNMFVNAFVREY